MEKISYESRRALELWPVFNSEFDSERRKAFIIGYQESNADNLKRIEELELQLSNEKLNSESLKRYWSYERDKVNELESRIVNESCNHKWTYRQYGGGRTCELCGATN